MTLYDHGKLKGPATGHPYTQLPFVFSVMNGEDALRRFEKCLCFTLASLNYYEDLLHKFSILIVYFPLASGGMTRREPCCSILSGLFSLFLIVDRTNVVNLGFEDSSINADEVSFENHEAEENETNRYIELLK